MKLHVVLPPVVLAFAVAHWVSVIFYFPERIEEDPWVLLYIFNGLSSVGGSLGAFIAMMWFLKRHKQPVRQQRAEL